MTQTIAIDLNQFPSDYKTCNWLKTLISECKHYFPTMVIFKDTIWMEKVPLSNHWLDIINEVSSVDFRAQVYNLSIAQIRAKLTK